MTDTDRSGPSLHRIVAYDLAQVVEALIFAADEPITARHIANVFESVTGEPAPSPNTVDAAVDELNSAYEEEGRAFRIHRWASGYRMATRPEMEPFLHAHLGLGRRQRLSRSLMETLAILAYRQPVTKPEVDFVRGVDSDYAIRRLLEMGFVDVVGRSESVGRPLLYGTTPLFLEQFGLDNLDNLPTLREIEELLQDPLFNRERAQLLTLERMERTDEEDAPHDEAKAAAEAEQTAIEGEGEQDAEA